MEARQLGKSDIQITPIVMGLWQAGKEMWAGIDDAESTRAMARKDAATAIADQLWSLGRRSTQDKAGAES